MTEKQIRRLAIRAFHIGKVQFGTKVAIQQGALTILPEIENLSDKIANISLDIIEPLNHDREINTIMDIIPISTKVVGRFGEGVTHTLTGVYMMLTGVDEDGRQMHEFGASNGNMREKLKLNKVGTPSETDYIIHMDVLLKGGQLFDRELANACFEVCDRYIQEIRKVLKQTDGREATESHEYFDKIRPGKTKVVLIKQIAGQGAMYDNQLFMPEPSGFGGLSIIDMNNMPVLLSPNEYRDGAIRALV